MQVGLEKCELHHFCFPLHLKQYFYYFQAELHDKMTRLNIAQRIRAKDNGEMEKELFLYSKNDVRGK